MKDIKAGNRSRRLSAKLREILLGIKSREQQIEAMLANEELDAETKASLVSKIRENISASRSTANRLEKRKQEVSYEDRSPLAAAPRGAKMCIPFYTSAIQEDHSSKWTRISRRTPSSVRAFFAVSDMFSTLAACGPR